CFSVSRSPPPPRSPLFPYTTLFRSPQTLEARADRGPSGGLAKPEGTNFLVFRPVINIVYQPERDRQLVAQMWKIEAGYDPATDTEMTLLVDPSTGETLFYGGRYDIVANEG